MKIHTIVYESEHFYICECGDRKRNVYIRQTEVQSNTG